MEEANLSRKFDNVALTNICAIRLEICVKKITGDPEVYFEVTELYRTLSLKYFLTRNHHAKPDIFYLFLRICAMFNLPAELIHEIAQYIPVIQREDYREPKEIKKMKTLRRCLANMD